MLLWLLMHGYMWTYQWECCLAVHFVMILHPAFCSCAHGKTALFSVRYWHINSVLATGSGVNRSGWGNGVEEESADYCAHVYESACICMCTHAYVRTHACTHSLTHPLSLSLSHTHTHARTRTRTQNLTLTNTVHTYTQIISHSLI